MCRRHIPNFERFDRERQEIGPLRTLAGKVFWTGLLVAMVVAMAWVLLRSAGI